MRLGKKSEWSGGLWVQLRGTWRNPPQQAACKHVIRLASCTIKKALPQLFRCWNKEEVVFVVVVYTNPFNCHTMVLENKTQNIFDRNDYEHVENLHFRLSMEGKGSLINFLYIFNFIWKLERHRDKEREWKQKHTIEKQRHFEVHFQNAHNMQDWARWKPGSWISIQVSDTAGREPTTWAITVASQGAGTGSGTRNCIHALWCGLPAPHVAFNYHHKHLP